MDNTVALSHAFTFTGEKIFIARFISSLPSQLNELFAPTESKKESSFTAEKALKEQLINRLIEIENLNDNWDGYGAAKPNSLTISNCKTFINSFSTKVLQYLDVEEIYPMPYGTVVMELYKGENLLSIEFGESKVGFFSEFTTKDNIEVESIDLNKEGTSYELFDAIKSFLQI